MELYKEDTDLGEILPSQLRDDLGFLILFGNMPSIKDFHNEYFWGFEYIENHLLACQR